jgi:regulator of sigma D
MEFLKELSKNCNRNFDIVSNSIFNIYNIITKKNGHCKSTITNAQSAF